MPVNQSSHTPDPKPLLDYPPQRKPIRKSKPKSRPSKLSKSPLSLSFSSEASRPQKTTGWAVNILQPFCNFELFPSIIQKIVASTVKLEQSQVLQSIYQLKTPENQLNHQKKIEKMRLLTLGQETILQNYLKEKCNKSMKPAEINHYYNFLSSKVQLREDLNDLRQRLSFYEASGSFTEDFNEFHEEQRKKPHCAENHSLLYDNFPTLLDQKKAFSEENESIIQESEEKECETRKEIIENAGFYSQRVVFFDEDRFLAKAEDFL